MAQRLKVDLSEHVVPLSSLFSFLRLPSFGAPFPHSAPTQAALADAVHDCCLIFLSDLRCHGRQAGAKPG